MLDLNIEAEASEQIDRTELTDRTRQGMPKVLSPGEARQEAGGVKRVPQAREEATFFSLEEGSCESNLVGRT